tara:strand:- start:664 stop:1380 length:717 start_codon:yes stop_codon:yes gene_type:complete
MKFKIIILLLLASCANYSTTSNKYVPYSSKGFAHIFYKLEDKKKNYSELFVSHNKLYRGTKIRIVNPENKQFLDLHVSSKIKYDNFYKVSISESIAKKLKLNLDLPFVEIYEIKKNKSFIAKKAVTEIEERKISNKAPVEKISINNISNIETKKNKTKQIKKYSIIIAEFYSKESAIELKKKLNNIINADKKLIHIREKNKKNYELLMGPYNTIKLLKNDYIALNNFGFEDLDIKINE